MPECIIEMLCSRHGPATACMSVALDPLSWSWRLTTSLAPPLQSMLPCRCIQALTGPSASTGTSYSCLATSSDVTLLSAACRQGQRPQHHALCSRPPAGGRHLAYNHCRR